MCLSLPAEIPGSRERGETAEVPAETGHHQSCCPEGVGQSEANTVPGREGRVCHAGRVECVMLGLPGRVECVMLGLPGRVECVMLGLCII